MVDKCTLQVTARVPLADIAAVAILHEKLHKSHAPGFSQLVRFALKELIKTRGLEVPRIPEALSYLSNSHYQLGQFRMGSPSKSRLIMEAIEESKADERFFDEGIDAQHAEAFMETLRKGRVK